jgi:hypothetical protein
MAYVVARPKGRFELREALRTPNGPRARTLAGFYALTDDALAAAARRARRPFDVGSVIASARRAGAPVGIHGPASGRSATVAATAGAEGAAGDSSGRFVEASRRMASSMRASPDEPRPADPGAVLIDLLGFADAVRRSQPARPYRSLGFPALSRLVRERTQTDPKGRGRRNRRARVTVRRNSPPSESASATGPA